VTRLRLMSKLVLALLNPIILGGGLWHTRARIGLRACWAQLECGEPVSRCEGVPSILAGCKMVHRALADIGPLLSASTLRSLTLMAWLYDPTFLQQVPSTLEVRMRGDMPQLKPCPVRSGWVRIDGEDTMINK